MLINENEKRIQFISTSYSSIYLKKGGAIYRTSWQLLVYLYGITACARFPTMDNDVGGQIFIEWFHKFVSITPLPPSQLHYFWLTRRFPTINLCVLQLSFTSSQFHSFFYSIHTSYTNLSLYLSFYLFAILCYAKFFWYSISRSHIQIQAKISTQKDENTKHCVYLCLYLCVQFCYLKIYG